MLASITPLGERSRHQRWPVTVAAHAVAAVAGGAATGALLAAAGSPVRGRIDAAAVLAVVVLAGLALDLAPVRVPSHRRQVDERWLRRYRGWVYGAGFGFQLGTGFLTIATTASIYATFAACLLAPSVAWGIAVGGVFGAVRGVVPLAARRVTTPAALAELHRRLGLLDAPTRRAAVVVQAALAAAVFLG